LLSGCASGEEVPCIIDGKNAVFTLKDGIVTKYTLNGSKVSQSEIDEINGTYFTSATNNEEGKALLNTYVQSVNGSCE
ncbi:MAG: hypothetical protein IJ093_00740, partial [Bacilli bacterium]|nr:hypothetical protein [Bacilli bacterium]